MGRTTNNNNKIKNVIAVTLTIVSLWLFIASITATTTTAAAETPTAAVTVKVYPSTQVVVTAGDAFTVDVIVENVTEMGADQATLHFDPQAMSVSQVTEGDFLKSAGTTLGAGLENIDNANGQVTFFYCLTTPGIGLSGSGTLSTVSFTTDPSSVRASGVFDLYLTDTMLVNGTGSLIPIDTIANGTCTISGPEPTSTAPSGGGSDNGGISDNSGVQPQNNTPEPGPTSSPTPKPTSVVTPTATSTPTPTSTSTPSKEGAPETESEEVVGFETIVVSVALAVTYFIIKRRR